MLEARNRVGGRVVSFTDLVPGGSMEGGAELIGTNHPIWMDYKARFSLSFLDVAEEDAEAPIVLNGRRLTAAQAEELGADERRAERPQRRREPNRPPAPPTPSARRSSCARAASGRPG